MAQMHDLAVGWHVLQDVHDAGEELEIYQRDWDACRVSPCISDWEPLDRLAHLQLIFAEQPYFGRELRYFNQAPWWYRVEFETPPEAEHAALRFGGVDYYARVWLNGTLLGEHEGYFEPFEFEVGHLLRKDEPNLLVVKVASPWDPDEHPGDKRRVWQIVRNMVKGTYEHDDTFVQRDVNPVGIWRPVHLTTHQGIRAGKPAITSRVDAKANRADVSIAWPVTATGTREVSLEVSLRAEPEGLDVAQLSLPARLAQGENGLSATLSLDAPRLWNTWDRGGPALYRAELEIREADETSASCTEVFGIRTVEVRRTRRHSC